MELSLSYAVKSAMEFAESVPPGRMQRTMFSAGDVAPFIGLVGASFVVCLPEDTPRNTNPRVWFQWFVKGAPIEAPQNEFEFMSHTDGGARRWLIDVGVTGALVADQDPRSAICTVRGIPLEGSIAGGLYDMLRQPIPPPKHPHIPESARFAFHAGSTKEEYEISVDENIAIACWFQCCDPNVEMGKGPMASAKTAASACVICICFQQATSK